jgi:uncharacterized protein YkwD
MATTTGVLSVVIASPAGAHAGGARSARDYQAHGCANANRSAGTASIPALRAAVVCLINQQRASHHLPALSADIRLDTSAQRWSNAMVAHHVFTHGTNFAARISSAGYRWSAAGENIATGYRTPRQVVRAWMDSAGHCENILSPTYGSVGTGINRHGVRGYASRPATWTQDFALALGDPAPSHHTGPAKGCPY